MSSMSPSGQSSRGAGPSRKFERLRMRAHANPPVAASNPSARHAQADRAIDGSSANLGEGLPLRNRTTLAQSPSLANSTLEPGIDLANVFREEMTLHPIGLKDVKTGCYLPDEFRRRWVSPESIRAALGDTENDLVEWVTTKASKTFVVTILSISDKSKRVEAMRSLFLNSYDDSCLPLRHEFKKPCSFPTHHRSPTVCTNRSSLNGQRKCDEMYGQQLAGFHHRVWDLGALQGFYANQWALIPHEFRRPGPRPEILHDEILLPFVPSQEHEDIQIGHFSEVKRGQIMRRFQGSLELIDSKENSTIEVAIKCFRSVQEKGYNIQKEWEKEISAYESLRELALQHLVCAIAAFKIRGRYFIVFEWADQGDLKTYWKNMKRSELTPALIYQWIVQLHGLSEALCAMHNTKAARTKKRRDSSVNSTRTNTGSSQSTLIQTITRSSAGDSEFVLESGRQQEEPVSVENAPPTVFVDDEHVDVQAGTLPASSTAEDENWRHGDIKPENILCFARKDSVVPTLKLADLGRAKQHYLASRMRQVFEWDQWRTKPYEPPDIYIDRRNRTMSRLYDVWSLGCVFFETLIWILYGEIWTDEMQRGSSYENEAQIGRNETPFWLNTENGVKITGSLEKMLKFLNDKDPECNGQNPSAIKELLSITCDKMLVVRLPALTEQPGIGERANIQIITDGLAKILNHSLKEGPALDEGSSLNERYLFTGGDRNTIGVLPKLPRERPSVPEQGNEQSEGVRALVPRQFGGLLDAAPQALMHGRSATAAARTYSNVPEDEWRYLDDDTFAINTYNQNIKAFDELASKYSGEQLCDMCAVHDFSTPLRQKVKSLEDECPLCAMLISWADSMSLTPRAVVELTLTPKEGLGLIGVRATPSKSPRRLRMCRYIGNSDRTPNRSLLIPDYNMEGRPSSTANGRVTVIGPGSGLPILPESGSSLNILLLKSWLEDCNRGHPGHAPKSLKCMSARRETHLPKRLLHVRSGTSRLGTRLIQTKLITRRSTKDPLKYLALSHPWGDSSKYSHFVTTIVNESRHEQGIPDQAMPRNFQDAVKITRLLGIDYLWIDALCILQKTEIRPGVFHPGDFADEAQWMQDIFSSAYCVLAASSANSMHSGLLLEGKPIARSARKAVSTAQGIVCDSPDDFETDVVNSSLSSRAWALQEHALARRTIFFTDNQIYWECSLGVRCESLSFLWNDRAALLGDSNFPDYAVIDQTKGAQITLFQKLYTDYCNLKFSHYTDKPFAISGLEQRLTEKFRDTSGAGVFGRHMGRCLLWKRNESISKLEQIDFSNAPQAAKRTPSWSFIAYEGKIEYLNIPGGQTDWQTLGLRLTGTSTVSWLSSDQDLQFNAKARDLASEAINSPNITYDDPGRSRIGVKCVVLGCRAQSSYILVVIPTQEPGLPGIYERVGVGFIPSNWIHGGQTDVEIR